MKKSEVQTLLKGHEIPQKPTETNPSSKALHRHYDISLGLYPCSTGFEERTQAIAEKGTGNQRPDGWMDEWNISSPKTNS